MKKGHLTPIALGLGWLISLGIVFVLGILSAFAFHLKPGAGSDNEPLEVRQMALVVESILGEPLNLAEVQSHAHRDRLPRQLEISLNYLVESGIVSGRELQLMHLARGLPTRKRGAAVQYLLKMAASLNRDLALKVFFRQWGREDGRSALAMAVRLEDLEMREWSVSAILAGWSQRQPSDAWNWCLQNPAANESHQANRLAEIVWYVAVVDEGLARTMIQQLPEGHAALLSVGISYSDFLLKHRGPDAAVSRLDEVPAEAREEAFRLIVQFWATHDPIGAMQVSLEMDPAWGGLMRDYAVAVWAQQDPEGSMVWIDEEFPGEERYRYVQAIAGQWVAMDGPGPLSRWLNIQDSLAGLDAAIQVLALEIMSDDPATALRWAQFISDIDQRAFHEAIIARKWLSSDVDTAYAYLQQSPLSPRARLLVFGEPSISVSPSPTVVASSLTPIPTVEPEEAAVDNESMEVDRETAVEGEAVLDEALDDSAEIPEE